MMDEAEASSTGSQILLIARKRKRDEGKGSSNSTEAVETRQRKRATSQVVSLPKMSKNNKGRKLRKPENERDILNREVSQFLEEEKKMKAAGKNFSGNQYYKRRRTEEKSKENPELPSRSCFFEGVKKRRAGEELCKRGGIGALTEKEEGLLEENVVKFESEYHTLTNEIIKREAAAIIVANRLGNAEVKGDDSAMNIAFHKELPDIQAVLGKNFLYRVRKKRFSLTKTSRGMEITRARKYQPEICLDWFRLYLHTCALRQIQVDVHSYV